MNQCVLRLRYIYVAVCLFSLLCVPPSLGADPGTTDQDHRAAATLYSGYAGKLIPPESITAAQLKPGLTRFEKNPAKNLSLYSLDYGGVQNGIDNRGYMRVTVNDELTDAAKAGWTVLRTDKVSGAEIFYKKVEKSDADKYLNIGVRRKFGNIVLAVAQRQPISMSPEEAARSVHDRFVALVDYAKQCKLFGGQVQLTVMSTADQLRLSGEAIPIQLDDKKETELVIRVEVLDNDGNARSDLKRLDLQLSGPVAKICKAKVDGKLVDLAQVFEVNNPQPATDVVLVLPAVNSEQTMEALYAPLAAQAGDRDAAASPDVSLKVGVAFK